VLDRASAEFVEAARAAKVAADRYRIYQRLIVVATVIDAQNLANTSPSATKSFDCTPVSTATFRQILIQEGVSLVGMDIDHIVPRSRGGADHPSNYQILPSSENRSLGATWDKAKCARAGAKCGDAIAVSHKCGSFRGPFP